MDKLRLVYEQTGRARWISHLDTMRTLQRGLLRAGVPIKYSEGFNPHAQISIVMPLSVGTESLCQLSDIRVKEDVDLASLPGRLTAVMPEGLRFLDAYEDYDADMKRHRFNPLGALHAQPDYEERMEEILALEMAACVRAYDYLPIQQDANLIRSILYSGVWRRYAALQAKRKESKS